MGWASGSSVLREVWSVTRDKVPERLRVDLLVELMEIFAGHDCDTLSEIVGKEWPESERAYEKWMKAAWRR